LRGVVFKEKVEIGFVVVDQAAKSRDIDLPEIGIHDVLDRQIENFLQKADFICFLLNKRVF